MNKLAIIFAGQGSQYTNMGLDFVEKHLSLQEMEKTASSILGFDTKEVLASDDGRLNETIYTQPLTLLASIYAFETLKEMDLNISAFAGFSLGEYSALYASGIFSFEQILRIIKVRSNLMHECALENPGKMAAILGLDSKKVEDICQKASSAGTVVLANYNSPIQSVISGDERAVSLAIEYAKAEGAKRAILLNVSGAFHSPLMKNAGDGLVQYLETIQHQDMDVPLYMNTTAKQLVIQDLYQEMESQIQSSVYFKQMIEHMINDGITHFIEVGPGKVLSSLIKKIDSNVQVSNLDKLEDMNQLKGWLSEYGFKE